MSYDIPEDHHAGLSGYAKQEAVASQRARNTISPADPLDNLEDTFRELSGRIASCRQRLAVKVDRMIGSRPETATNGPHSEPYCLLEWASTLRQEVELLEIQLDRIS